MPLYYSLLCVQSWKVEVKRKCTCYQQLHSNENTTTFTTSPCVWAGGLHNKHVSVSVSLSLWSAHRHAHVHAHTDHGVLSGTGWEASECMHPQYKQFVCTEALYIQVLIGWLKEIQQPFQNEGNDQTSRITFIPYSLLHCFSLQAEKDWDADMAWSSRH